MRRRHNPGGRVSDAFLEGALLPVGRSASAVPSTNRDCSTAQCRDIVLLCPQPLYDYIHDTVQFPQPSLLSRITFAGAGRSAAWALLRINDNAIIIGNRNSEWRVVLYTWRLIHKMPSSANKKTPLICVFHLFTEFIYLRFTIKCKQKYRGRSWHLRVQHCSMNREYTIQFI